MNELESLVFVRKANDSDAPFIYASFLKGLYYDNEFYNMIPKADFMENYKRVVESLLFKCQVNIACLKEDPSVIVGYSITTGNTLHWLYVKKSWRKQGVAKLLVPVLPNFFSHFTNLGLILRKTKYPELTFNPFKL